MRFAAVQFDIVWEDKAANHAIVERMLDEAAVEPGTFVLLPELGDTGFSFNLDRIVDERTLDWGRRIAVSRGIWLQVGFARRAPSTDGKGRNCAAVIAPDGQVVGEYQKIHPFSYGKESQFYSGGDHLLLVDCGGVIVCPLICYDLRFPELWRLAALAHGRGAEVFTLGASWPSARQHHWRSLIPARAVENQAAVVAVNRIGRDPHLSYLGGSMILGPRGDVLADASADPVVLQADIDPQPLRRWREEFPTLRDARPDHLGSIRVDRSSPRVDGCGG